jgi:sugar lactone lactonase YvrE
MSAVLYAACTDDGTISIFDRAADGQLERRSAQVAVSGGPMWLATDPRHRYLYCPTLAGNEVLSFAIGADGSLSPLGSPVSYPDVGEVDRTGAAWAGDACPCICSARKVSPHVGAALIYALQPVSHIDRDTHSSGQAT